MLDSRLTASGASLSAPRILAWPAALCALLFLCYWPILRALFEQWQVEQDAGHGMFVPLIAAWALWERREQLAAVPDKPSYWGLAILIWSAIQAILSELGAELYLSRLAFLFAIAGLLVFLHGFALLRAAAFPLGLLLFAIPIPNFLYREITFPLQILASQIAEHSLDLLGYSVLREGNLLELAGQKLSVVEACSGLRSLLTLSFFTVVYAWFVDPRPWMRWILLLVAAPAAVFANAGRIVLTGIVGEYDQELAYGTFHAVSGWVILMVAMILTMVAHAGLSTVFPPKRKVR